MELKNIAVAATTRRTLLMRGGAFALAAPWVSRALAQGASDTLVITGTGGSTQRMIETEIFPEFGAKHGIKNLVYVAGGGSELMAKYRSQQRAPTIDVAWLSSETLAASLREDLLQPLDSSQIPAKNDLPDAFQTSEFMLPMGQSAVGLLYNSQTLSERGIAVPTSWNDLWDDKFKGHAGLLSITSTGTKSLLALISRIATGDWKNFDAAIDRFATLRPNLLDVFSAPGPLDAAFQQGDVWIAPQVGLRALQFKNAGAPIVFAQPEEGCAGYQVELGVLKGAPNKDAAHAWIDYMLQPATQEKIMTLLGYTPMNPKVNVSDEYREFFPDPTTVFSPDWSYLSENLEQIVDAWNRKVER
ncbi:extracellular solute-binding protein [Paracoccus onubensis]|uniref:ABC transporter substrate-binding protein n=1 Tax=Paracoccus onubensis TaxID=1675788 RepID=UPI00272FC6EF|nr:extracellular solute-binding protein [Paracoccus onubensis]MDP0930312.1 extracellular solute-binding protein [Paracoccus onubensis]